MLHLFFVHSFATFHCSLGVIEKEEIRYDDCIFIVSRGFEIPNQEFEIPSTTLDFYGSPNLNTIRRVLLEKKRLKERRKELDNIVKGRDFLCYTPQAYYDFVDLIISHPRCQGFSFLEEGLTSYYRPGEINRAYPPWTFSLRTRFLRKLLFGGKLRSKVEFFRSDYQNVYGFSENSFPDWDRKKVLGISRLLPELCHEKRPGYPPIIVFDALVELRKIGPDVLAQVISQFLDQCIRLDISEVRYKFHPSQQTHTSINDLNRVFAEFRDKLDLKELSKSTSLEALFSLNEMPVFVFNSASGLYAAIAGQSVFSLNPWVLELAPQYKETADALPEVYKDLVRPIEEFTPEMRSMPSLPN